MSKFYKVSLMALFVSLCSVASYAQKVTGRVADNEDKPVPGAFVMISGTGQGTQTDPFGMYTLEVGAGSFEIEVRAMNFSKSILPVTVGAGQTVTLNFKLTSESITIGAIEIIGYGVERNRPTTGSVSKISGKDITAVRTPSFEAALQGQSAGLQVSQGSGAAGSGSVVRIRGISSISAGGDPLYIIDGIPMTQDYFLRGNSGAMNNNPLASINPNDIEKVEVRKDAAAAGEYGSRAANGVIIITTKRAKEKGWKFDFSTNTGISTPASMPHMLNTEEYLRIRQEAWENDGGTGYVWLPNMTTATDDAATRKAAYLKAGKTNTDWVSQTIGKGVKYGASFAARYGGKKNSVYFSLSYDNNESFLLGNSYQRISARVNPEFILNEKMKLNLSISGSRGLNNRVDAAWSGGLGDAMSNALPYYPVYDSTGKYQYWKDEFGNTKNPVAYRNQLRWTSVEDRVINTGRFIYMPKKNLFIVATGGMDWMHIGENKLTPATFDLSNGQGNYNSAQNLVQNYSYNITAEYSKEVKPDLNASVLIGHELQHSKTVSLNDYIGNLGTDIANFSDVNTNAANRVRTVNNPTQFSFLGFFAKGSINYKSKYFMEATFRRDGSSRFGVNNKFGNFPSASLGWIISEEKFMKNVKAINFMKLRTSFGLTGNSDIPANAQYALYSATNNGIYYNQNPIIYPTQAGNPNLRWETTSNFSVALETGFWQDRFTVTIEAYRKHSKDVLMNVSLPANTGFTNFWDNVATVLNEGIELTTVYNWTKSKTFHAKTTANFSYNYNELQSIGNYTPDAVSGGTNDSRVIVGRPIGSFYLVKFDHIDAQTGLPVYITPQGSYTTDYDNSIRQYVGSGLPKVYGGLTQNFTWKNFSLTALFTYSLGAKIFDSSAKRQLGVVTSWNMRQDILDRWRNPGDESTFGRLTLDETTYGLPSGFPWWNTSLFVYKADFLRLRNLSLDYQIPADWAKKIKMNNLVIGVSATNLFTITNFPGLDPEIVRDFENAQDRNLSPNVTYLTPMQERSYNFRLSANF